MFLFDRKTGLLSIPNLRVGLSSYKETIGKNFISNFKHEKIHTYIYMYIQAAYTHT